MTHLRRDIGEKLYEWNNEARSKSLLTRSACAKGMYVAFTLLCVVLFASCSNDKGSANGDAAAADAGKANAAGQENTIEGLLRVYDRQARKEHPATADKIFGLLFQEEMTDTRITVTNSTPPDSIDMLVWYWAGEHLWSTQNYAEGLRYAEKALPLTYRLGDLSLQGYCERLVGLFYFRQSDYPKAVEHVSKSLELSKKENNKSNTGSALNTLAGICLATKQLNESEKYILEAIHYCEEANDSNLLPIRYGMASEIYHAKGDDVLSLSYAHRAFLIDSLLGKTARMGIRLSQMAAAQIALKRDAAAEQSIKRAIPILENTGNEVSLSICRNQIGELLNRRRAHAEAADYFRKAADSFAARKDKYNESRAQMGLYEALKESNPSEAAQHLLRYAALKDSIYQQDVEQAISQYNVKYKTEELAHKQQQERLEKRVILFGSIVLIIVLLFIVVVNINASRIRRRNHIALQKLSTMREHFFTNITHEFRTPLTVIIGLGEHIAADENIENLKAVGDAISRQGRSLLLLINQILDVAKLKSNVSQGEYQRGDIVGYIYMIFDGAKVLAAHKDIHYRFRSQEKAFEMDFIPDYITKIVGNLISNAIKFTPNEGMITVCTETENENFIITVQDNGCGIPAQDLPYIFDAFYQGNTNSRSIGSGIGLSLAKQLVEALNGTITVESEENRGTKFTVTLPAPSLTSNSANPVSPLKEPPTVKDIFISEGEDAESIEEDDDILTRILIVEDNNDISSFIGSVINNANIYHAHNGKEGLEKALQIVPDVIITDIMMPEMDGIEMCERIRQSEILCHIPIIIISARAEQKDKIEGIKSGAIAYLNKPFSAEELNVTIDTLLEHRKLLQEHFARNSAKDTAPAEQFSVNDKEFLNKVIDLIHAQMASQNININDLADGLNMTSRQLREKINAITGDSISKYILQVRMLHAKHLLDSNKQYTIAEVAYRCGYEENSNFTRAFKMLYGITPTVYRKMP